MSDVDLPSLYLKTVVSLDQDGEMVPANGVLLMRDDVLHVITAWNPGDARPTRAENDAANERLYEKLVELGLDPVPAVGADPDSDHFEESWAIVGLDDESARAIGAAFGQVAVFRLANGVQTVLACSADWTRSRSL